MLIGLLWVLKLIVLRFRFMSHFELSDEIILNLNLGFDMSLSQSSVNMVLFEIILSCYTI